MAKQNRNLDVDMDYSKIEYDATDTAEGSKKVDSIDLDGPNAPSEGRRAVEISDGAKTPKKPPEKKSRRMGREKAGKSKIRKQSVIGTVAICLLLAVMLVVMVQGRVETNQTSSEIADLRKQLSNLEAERKELNSKIDSATDMRVLEEYAQKNGMVSSSDVDTVYVGSDGEDDVEVYEPDDELFGGLFGTLLSAISESFSRTWNTISGNE